MVGRWDENCTKNDETFRKSNVYLKHLRRTLITEDHYIIGHSIKLRLVGSLLHGQNLELGLKVTLIS